MKPSVLALEASDRDEVVAVLHDAFFDYPTMRFVLGPSEKGYADRLTRLIGLFLDATLEKSGTIFGTVENGQIVAVADAVHSTAIATAELARLRSTTWKHIGSEEKDRYEAYSAMTREFLPSEPHLYLSMLGVRRAATGRGLARPLLDAVQEWSLVDPISTGVALETEDPKNVEFYQHFGYQLVGHGKVGTVESWGFFRPDEA